VEGISVIRLGLLLAVVWVLDTPAAFAAPASSAPILDGPAIVPAGSYMAWRVPADEGPAQACVLLGSLQAGKARDRFVVAVLAQSDFTSWKKGYRANPVYLARQSGRVEVRARLPRPDVYYVVVSNPQSPPGTCTVRGTLRLVRVPATNAVAGATPSPGVMRRDLVSFSCVVVLALGLALWSIYDHRAEVETAEKRAA
jgi:hypothetical protein